MLMHPKQSFEDYAKQEDKSISIKVIDVDEGEEKPADISHLSQKEQALINAL